MKGNFRKFAVMMLVMAFLVVTVFPGSTVFAQDDAVKITILHTNDTHGRIKAGKYDGMGFAKISTKIKEMKETNENVLVLDAGDTFHGQTIASLVEGESVVEVMNAIGYDAMTAGNHDFNYGQERLLELSKMTNFPILSSNVVKEDGSTLLLPYIIKEFDGVKVGIFGLSTPETTTQTHPKNVEGLTFNDPIKAAKETVAVLKDQADVIVALSHLGLSESSPCTSKAVAEGVEGIDVIVDGHSHTVLNEGLMVGDTLIAQTGEYDKNLGIINLTVENKKVTQKAAKLFTKEEGTDLAEDENILSLVKDIETENEKITAEVVGNTKVILDGEREHVRTGETNLGNLITQAMLKASGAEMVITNGGGIRASIDVGEIDKGDVIEVLPFGNYVVVKEVKGKDIIAALELGISDYPNAKGAFPHVAGMTFTFDANKEAGNRILEVKVGENLMDPNKTYKLATNDFLAAGGDGYTMLADGKILAELPQLDEIVVDYIKEFGTEDVKVDQRVKAIEKTEKVGDKIYTVKTGEVLWKIAKKFGMTYEKIADYNQLKTPNLIYPGQNLMIPQE